jgi:hypothetical protein
LKVVSILCSFFLGMYPLHFLLIDSNRKCRGLIQRKKLEPVTWNFLTICKLFLCVTGLLGNFYLNLWQLLVLLLVRIIFWRSSHSNCRWLTASLIQV